MKSSFFIYSENKTRDAELVRGLKNWLPLEIDIVEADIKDRSLKTLEGKTINYAPVLLQAMERPIYITNSAYINVISIERRWDISKARDAYMKFFNDLRHRQEIICGRTALKEFIEGLKKPQYS